MVVQLSGYIKYHWIVHLRRMTIMASELYLNKADVKKKRKKSGNNSYPKVVKNNITLAPKKEIIK